VIHIHDKRLVPLIARGTKTTHRFPASYRMNGEIAHPKITAGTVHKVYVHAPFGSGRKSDAKPLAEVLVTNIQAGALGDTNDEDVRTDGFASLEAFVLWWNRVFYKKALRFDSHIHHPIWIVTFELQQMLPAGEKLVQALERKKTGHGQAQDTQS
jgi:hypothetical protein